MCVRLDSNQRHTSGRGALPTELLTHMPGLTRIALEHRSVSGETLTPMWSYITWRENTGPRQAPLSDLCAALC